jgi:hypothetical protein
LKNTNSGCHQSILSLAKKHFMLSLKEFNAF